MAKHGVPMFCVNCSVGLSLSGIAGITTDVTEGILSSLPFGAVSVVGIKKIKEIRNATYARHIFGRSCINHLFGIRRQELMPY